MSDTHDFNDGNGPVPAHRHSNGGGWVADTAKVDATAYVGPGALVYSYARVCGKARVCDNAKVYGYAQVYGDAQIYGDAQVFGFAKIHGYAWVCGDDNSTKIAELTRKLDALRNEVKTARILGASSPLGFEFARKQWEDAKEVTDTLNALEDER